MTQVIDYSAGKISGEAIRTAGYAGSIRYAGTPGRTKNITKSEFDSHRAAGRGVALIYENTAGDALRGYAAGQAAARAIAADADAIGWPRSSRPLYFACDTDVVTDAQFASVMSYLDGAASVLGGAGRVGVYGEHEVVRRALEGGHARFGWQTAAWSGGKHYAGAHLYQHVGTVYVGGVACDVNDVLKPDWGQHTIQGDTMSDADAYTGFRNLILNMFRGDDEEVRKAFVGVVWAAVLAEPDDPANPTAEARLAMADQRIKDLGTEVTQVKQALASVQPGGAVDLDALADKLWGRFVQHISTPGNV